MAVQRTSTIDTMVSTTTDLNYSRRVVNYTSKPLWIIDHYGNKTLAEPRHRPHNDRTPEHLLIEEQFYDRYLDSFKPEVKNRERYSRVSCQRVCVKTRIDLETLALYPDGLDESTLNIHITDDINSELSRKCLNSGIGGVLSGRVIASWQSIELMDPHSEYGVYFHSMGDHVIRIIPNRDINSAPCVRLTYCDPSYKEPVVFEYPIEEFIEGPGKCGIRFYRTKLEAVEDARSPGLVSLNKEREAFEKDKKAYGEEYSKELQKTMDARLLREREEITLRHQEDIDKLIEDNRILKLDLEETRRASKVKIDDLQSKLSEESRSNKAKADMLEQKNYDECRDLKLKLRKAESELESRVQDVKDEYRQKLLDAENRAMKSQNTVIKERSGLIGGLMKLASSALDLLRWGLGALLF